MAIQIFGELNYMTIKHGTKLIKTFISDFYLCDIHVWVRTEVITDIAKTRSHWTASMMLTMYLQISDEI